MTNRRRENAVFVRLSQQELRGLNLLCRRDALQKATVVRQLLVKAIRAASPGEVSR